MDMCRLMIFIITIVTRRFPVVAAVGVACGFAVYSITRNLYTNPEVQ